MGNNVGDGIYAARAIPRTKVSSHRQIFWQFQIVRPISLLDVQLTGGSSKDQNPGQVQAVSFGCSLKLLSELHSVQITEPRGGGRHTLKMACRSLSLRFAHLLCFLHGRCVLQKMEHIHMAHTL